jgi:exodeoxyribonuclease-3
MPQPAVRSSVMKLYSWNVNGTRAAERNGFLKWFEAVGADVVCLQETKARPEQLSPELLNPLKLHPFLEFCEQARL